MAIRAPSTRPVADLGIDAWLRSVSVLKIHEVGVPLPVEARTLFMIDDVRWASSGVVGHDTRSSWSCPGRRGG